MRVTNRMLGEDFLINLRRNLKNMQKTQNQLASGKEISRPSDDPYRVSRALSLDTTIRKNEQYARNINDSRGWTETVDNALAGLTDSLNRVRELVLSGASGTLGDSEYNALREEVQNIAGGIAQLGNTNYDGRYIFGGQQTTRPPFAADWFDGPEEVYLGDDKSLERELVPGVTTSINVHGQQLLGRGTGQVEGPDLAETLRDIVGVLAEPESEDVSRLGGELLKQVDEHIENILNLRTANGALSNRLETLRERNAADNLNMTKLLSETEDIDFAEKIMEFSMLENVYQASLSAGSRILQPTLLDYL